MWLSLRNESNRGRLVQILTARVSAMAKDPGEPSDLDSRTDGLNPAKAFVTQLTPEGRGAIAVVRVWGPDAIDVTSDVFRSRGRLSLAQTPPGRLRLGRMGDALGDEVVAVVLDSATPAVEVQCHGGAAAVELVVAALEKAGAMRTEPWQATEQLAGDRLSAAAFSDLAHASTILTAEILLDQAQGALRGELARLAETIDQQPAQALADVEELIRRATVGVRLLFGWRVVIAGRPNVGKSRLLNALAGFPRAIVDPAPGTTRDAVTIRTSFGGWPVEIVDTAGLRTTDDAIESLGIAMSHREQERADLVLLVLDRSEPLQSTDRRLVATMTGALPIANKSDLAPAWSVADIPIEARDIVTVSADRGDGVTSLIATIAERLVPDPPPVGKAVPFRPAHIDDLSQVRTCLLANDRTAAVLRLSSMIHGSARGNS
jgi:tRNA modification GTPase